MGTIEERTLALLKEVLGVLQDHWFEDVDGEEYNNDDVIEVSKKIDKFLEELK